MSADPDSVTPPEGQLSFSGIPEAQFVEDVDSHMAGEDNAEHKLKVRAVTVSDTIIPPMMSHRCHFKLR